MSENLEELCQHKKCAEEQRKHEIEQVGHDKGCEGYKRAGCYSCDGLNKDCFAYYTGKNEKKIK